MSEILHHIAITVSNIESSSAFYKNVFGFTPITRLTDLHSKNPGAWFQVGSFELHLQGRAQAPERTEQHFALITKRYEKIVELAPQNGGRIEPAKLLEGFSARCFVFDPDNNKIEILGRPE